MSVLITDCTIRDGGYLLNKNSSPDFVKGVLSGLAKAGIEFIETGFLQDIVNGESIVYRNSQDVIKYLPAEKNEKTNFLGFCDNSRYSFENLDKFNGKSFKWLRISFAKHELDAALEFCDKVQKEKGYIVQFNPMNTISYSESELEYLINKVNKINPGSLSIVDTFGIMYLDDLKQIFSYINKYLNKNIKIGLHSHDNLKLSCALAEYMVILAEKTGRDVIVDGSLLGMGRGAGNASTELLASFLNKKFGYNYNVSVLLETIEKYILPLFQQNINWGYDLPMFICGSEQSHVDNISYLTKNTNCSINDMYQIISRLDPAFRTRYGKGYSKTDFSQLQKVYENYMQEKGC